MSTSSIKQYFLLEYPKEFHPEENIVWIKGRTIEVARCTGLYGIWNWILYTCTGYTHNEKTLATIKERLLHKKALLLGEHSTDCKQRVFSLIEADEHRVSPLAIPLITGANNETLRITPKEELNALDTLWSGSKKQALLTYLAQEHIDSAETNLAFTIIKKIHALTKMALLEKLAHKCLSTGDIQLVHTVIEELNSFSPPKFILYYPVFQSHLDNKGETSLLENIVQEEKSRLERLLQNSIFRKNCAFCAISNF